MAAGAPAVILLLIASACTSSEDPSNGPPSTVATSSAPVSTSVASPVVNSFDPSPRSAGDIGTAIELPPGFEIALFASNVLNARSMALGADGTVFVGTRTADNLYALVDRDRDFRADQGFILGRGMNSPNGVAFRDGSLYVAEINRVLRYDDIEASLSTPPDPVIVTAAFPINRQHGWKFIRFGPDGNLYVPVGAPCNVCEPPGEIFGTITRMKPDGTALQIFSTGVRNSVGFDWHPETAELWFTDNGRDAMGDDLPPDELNHAPEAGLHFGFPYCHGATVADPEFGDIRTCGEFTAPAMPLGPHVAALGMRFYTGDMFPEGYRNQILIAEHGSSSRSTPIGYRIMLVRVEDGQAADYEVFAEGWLQGDTVLGRPVDLLELPDGSLLVSDDTANAIYRISYRRDQ